MEKKEKKVSAKVSKKATKKADTRVIIATKQEDIDLFNDRINEVKKDLQEFLHAWNFQDLGELKMEDFKATMKEPKEQIYKILESRLTEVPVVAGLSLSKEKLIDLVDIDYSQLESKGYYATGVSKRYGIDINRFYSIENNIVTVNVEEVNKATEKFITYANSPEEETLYTRLEEITKSINDFNNFVKKSNASSIDLTGITGARLLGDYFKYNNETREYYVPLHSFNLVRQYVDKV